MKSFAIFSILFSQLAFSQVYESNVDFAISSSVLETKTQVAFEYLTPQEFRKRDLSLMDIPKMNATHVDNNQMIVAKIAFITKKSFDSLSYKKLNSASYIKEMLDSVEIKQKDSPDFWDITNVAKAYNIPFRVSFDFRFKEVTEAGLNEALSNYIRDEVGAFKQEGRERYLLLDMTNFSQLIYRNYSVVYMKELSSKETLIIGGVVSAFSLSKANSYFNYPPFATTKGTMLKNIRTQTIHMINKLRN